MPYVMALEGPRLRPLDGAHSELLGRIPRPYWRVRQELSGILDPIVDHKLGVVIGLIVGAYLAGSKRGQRLVRSVLKKRR